MTESMTRSDYQLPSFEGIEGNHEEALEALIAAEAKPLDPHQADAARRAVNKLKTDCVSMYSYIQGLEARAERKETL